MKSTFTSLTFALLVAALLQPATVVAQPAPTAPGFGGPHGPGPEAGPFFLDRMSEALDLTADQIAEIEQIMSAHRIGTAGLRAEARAAHEAVRELEESSAFDESAIRMAAERAAAAQIELAVERARLKSQIHAVLTPEQAATAAELRAERGERGPRARAPRGRR